jgi:hypothetical protein
MEKQQRLECGALVKIHSLQSEAAKHYNGREGFLRTFNQDKQRWSVLVCISEDIIWCKSDNLAFLIAPSSVTSSAACTFAPMMMKS